MGHEVEQPTYIVKPTSEDPLRWAHMSRINTEWIRVVAPQLNLDVKKIVLGDVLDSILTDDAGAFGMWDEFSPANVELSRGLLFIRMDWEQEPEEVPADIKNQLRIVQKKLKEKDWVGEKNFREAQMIWETDVRLFIERRINTNKKLQVARAYSSEVARILSPYWQAFLYGEKK